MSLYLYGSGSVLAILDDAVLRRIDRGDGAGGGADGDFADADDSTYFYLTDPQFGVLKVLSDTGQLQESVLYTPYGEASHHWPGDIDGDGDLDASNYSFMLMASNAKKIHEVGYNVEADLNADGRVNTADLTLFLGWYDGSGRGALADGWISDPEGPDNPVGYGGYQFVRQLKAYCVRHRWFEPELGRWLERDPAGYVDGMSLYLYGSGSPLNKTDADGRHPVLIIAAALLLGEALFPQVANAPGPDDVTYQPHEYDYSGDVTVATALVGGPLVKSATCAAGRVAGRVLQSEIGNMTVSNAAWAEYAMGGMSAAEKASVILRNPSILRPLKAFTPEMLATGPTPGANFVLGAGAGAAAGYMVGAGISSGLSGDSSSSVQYTSTPLSPGGYESTSVHPTHPANQSSSSSVNMDAVRAYLESLDD